MRSLLRIKDYHDTVEAQAKELASWNRLLETRVNAQVEELERLRQLRRFLSPQLADLVVSRDDANLLKSHRREITVVFCDLRGFTAFSGTADPEEVMAVLGEFHQALGELVFEFEGTLERFAGDALMIFFNDPFPCDDPPLRAVRMALAMQDRVAGLSARWRKRGHGQIPLGPTAFAAVETSVLAESLGPLTLKGFHRPVQAYLVTSPAEAVEALGS